MPLPLLFALVVAQGQSAPPAGQTSPKPISQSGDQTPQQPFTSSFDIAEPNRIAITPKLDGKLDDEEWDPLFRAPNFQSFFQWEPGKLYLAAVVPTGRDVLASFDLHGDGWLHGKDNLEVRISSGQGKPTVTARLLDCNGINGPTWIDEPGFAVSSVAVSSSDGVNTTIESAIVDTGIGLIPFVKGAKMMMRVDDPLSTDPPAPPYLPRSLAPITLVMARSAALPGKLRFNPEMVGRSGVAGETTRLRLGFDGSNEMKLQKLEMHTEGPARNDSIQMTVPFPPFDSKGRSYVDYSTAIADGSPEGYRILRGTLTTVDNISAITECSYRVGPLVDFELVQQLIPTAALDRSMRITFYVKSNSTKNVKGDVTIVVPDPLRILNGAEKSASISISKGQSRQSFELLLPAKVEGTFPVRFIGTANGKKFEQTQFLTVGH